MLATIARALDTFSGTAPRSAADHATDAVRMAIWLVIALRTVAQMTASAMDAEALDTFQGSALMLIAHLARTATGRDIY